MSTSLDGIRVLDLTSDVGGAYATKLLADLGAEVVLAESGDGSPLRRRPPLLGSGTSAMFAYLSGAKQSVRRDDFDQTSWADLVWSADIVVRDTGSPSMPRPPHQVVVDLSAFGATGPYADWRGSDIATWALGGYLSFTGDPDREPLLLPGSQAELHAGAQAAFAALVGLWERRIRGEGQRVEVAALDATLAAHVWLVSSWAACGLPLPRVPSDLIRASDGWVYVMRIVPSDELFVMIDRPDLGAEGLTEDVVTWFANIPRVFEAVAAWAIDKTVDEIVELGQALRIAVTPVLDAQGVTDDPQLESRSWWERCDGDEVQFPGQPYVLTASPSARRGTAPTLGADIEAVRAETAGSRTATARATPSTASVEPPLRGLKVVEVTTNWAGPVAARFLADLGADVVKVEWATKPATRALFWPGPTQDQQRQGHHRAMYFNELNRNKRDVCLDLSQPDGSEIFLDLLRTADVLIENNSARVMPNLGLDWDRVRAANPRLIMVSMSGYGASGPRRDWVAYGANIETTSGLTSVTGYPDGVLSRTTLFYADPVSGIHASVAIMAALEHRRRTGEGQFIDMSLNECGAVFNNDALVSLAATGELPGPRGNRDARFAPHGVYRCAGDDNWVAIAVQDHTDWRQLAEAMGRPDLATDADLANLDGRQARHDELDDAISEWTQTLEQYEVAHLLQQRGVSGAPVLANWQIQADPHIHDRGLYSPIVHPVVGVYPTFTWPWRFERTSARLERPAPLFAQHNREVLREAGLSEERIDELYATGITADEPAQI